MIFGALQVTKVLSTEEAKRAIEGSGKDFGKSSLLAAYYVFNAEYRNGLGNVPRAYSAGKDLSNANRC